MFEHNTFTWTTQNHRIHSHRKITQFPEIHNPIVAAYADTTDSHLKAHLHSTRSLRESGAIYRNAAYAADSQFRNPFPHVRIVYHRTGGARRSIAPNDRAVVDRRRRRRCRRLPATLARIQSVSRSMHANPDRTRSRPGLRHTSESAEIPSYPASERRHILSAAPQAQKQQVRHKRIKSTVPTTRDETRERVVVYI